MKTAEFSVIDTILDEEEAEQEGEEEEINLEDLFDYDNYWQEDYIDPWWKYDIGADLFKWTNNWWYGTWTYYSKIGF